MIIPTHIRRVIQYLELVGAEVESGIQHDGGLLALNVHNILHYGDHAPLIPTCAPAAVNVTVQ